MPRLREPRGRLSRRMREIQGVCGRQEASAGKPLHGLPRGNEQKAKPRALA
nr:MAG TPA: hypothetical protein [Caudoviricetes sp.]